MRIAEAQWLWPDALDALIAAPRHHTLLFENDRVRVLEACIGPGDTVPVHTHRWPSVHYVVSWADFIRRDADGAVLVDTRSSGSVMNAPTVLWSKPLPPHSLENVGRTPMRVVSVELKTEGP